MVNGKRILENKVSSRQGLGKQLYLVASICSKDARGNTSSAHRGAFETADAAFENIENYGHLLFESYYDYLVVEEKWQGFDSLPTREFWFKWNYLEESDSRPKIGYEPTDKPDWANGTVCWN
jgi:hypothetical protein